MAKSRISIAKPDIVRFFDEQDRKIYTLRELGEILEANRSFWRLAQSTTTRIFIEYLIEKAKLSSIRLEFPNRPIARFCWGKVPSFEVIQSIDPDGYFSHYTAVMLNGLTEQLPKRVYFNVEQFSTGESSGLSQATINRAFGGKCRQSKNIAQLENNEICLISGKNTNNLGVGAIDTTFGNRLRVTNIERTLIDATVRSIYCGGVAEVAKAFELAYGTVSINKLAAYLRKLSYTYPYHQSIGFYLTRAKRYSASQIGLLREFPIKFDFYLSYDMHTKDYVDEWKLFVPKGFKDP